ncbi:MAG: DUF523 and DUF1722 domain-containing protein [candidate division Zixibacteria bacterium]|nr:DUF523 and DUF1722 domain-containing protein [candidate division Zixibacteria bacterium]
MVTSHNPSDSPATVDPIRVGISTCLLGQKVRFDAGHKRDRYITDILGEYFSFVPVCPELEVGMGVPREAVRLVGNPESPSMVGRQSGTDWTERMNTYSADRVARRDLRGLSGYILKKDSPSCGMARVKVYDPHGMPQKSGAGLYAAALQKQHPLLPIEEEGRLNDPRLRDNFIIRVFAYSRLQEVFKGRFAPKNVVAFHAAHKYLMLAHSPKHFKLLGPLVAAITQHNPDDFREQYCRLFMEGLAVRSTVPKNVNVLQHIVGFLKKDITAFEKADILKVIDEYHRELLPLVVPVTLINHYIRKHDVHWVKDQVYLNPHPKEMMLRNHV